MKSKRCTFYRGEDELNLHLFCKEDEQTILYDFCIEERPSDTSLNCQILFIRGDSEGMNGRNGENPRDKEEIPE